MPKLASFHPAYTDLVESWSGYALRRAGQAVTPFIVPALDQSGHTNLNCSDGAIRFWFRPYWTSATIPNGSGPGVAARLLELTVVDAKDALPIWSLEISPDGAALLLTGATENGAEDLLEVPIDWLAGEWHLVSLNYGPKGSALSIDGKLAAEGSGTLAVPSKVAALSVGSDLTGGDPAGGEFDEIYAFARPLLPLLGEFYYGALSRRATLGPITADEEAAWMAAALKRHAEREAMMELMRSQQLTNSAVCITNVPVFLTNMTCALDTNGIATVNFDILGGTNEVSYEIFSTTNLLGSSITNSTWQREGQGFTCNTYQLTNQTSLSTFYVLGLPLDSDGDGLTDAYERLVSKTNPDNGNTDDDDASDFLELLLGRNPLVGGTTNDATGTLNLRIYTPLK